MLIDVPVSDLTCGASGRFYTYVYRDVRGGREGVAIYVGKGTENSKYGKCGRAKFHWTRGSSSRGLREILREFRVGGLEPVIEIVGRFETEHEAFAHEAELITRYGRRDLGTGPLCNLSDGGEGPVGFRHTVNAKEKIAAASRQMHADSGLAARRAANISAALSRPAAKARRSEFMKEVHARDGSKEARIAAQKKTFATDEQKARRSTATRNAHAQPKTKARHSNSLKSRWAEAGARDEQSDRMRRLYDDREHKQKQAAGVRAYFASPEYAAKRAAKAAGRGAT